MTRSRKLLLAVTTFICSTIIALVIVEGIVRATNMAPEIIPIEVSADEGMCARSDNHYLSFVMKPNYRSAKVEYGKKAAPPTRPQGTAAPGAEIRTVPRKTAPR